MKLNISIFVRVITIVRVARCRRVFDIRFRHGHAVRSSIGSGHRFTAHRKLLLHFLRGLARSIVRPERRIEQHVLGDLAELLPEQTVDDKVDAAVERG